MAFNGFDVTRMVIYFGKKFYYISAASLLHVVKLFFLINISLFKIYYIY